ncbi:MAG: hypothetical protein ACK5LR_05975 [Mangrovibacterium sp.]
MICFEAHIDAVAEGYFREKCTLLSDFRLINEDIKSVCGINNFFLNQDVANDFISEFQHSQDVMLDSDRRAYGDFQTNSNLTDAIVDYIGKERADFEFVLEPTCGKGNFIISVLKRFSTIKKLVGVEIYQPYVWETKFKILGLFLSQKVDNIPEIDIIHADAFEFSYESIAEETINYKTLIIGNPPWVTNSELGAIESKNLPQKGNFKKLAGLDAITGKGNFDIGESISTTLIKAFQKHKGRFAFLVKNSVIKNIMYDQKQNHFAIAENEKLNIDAKKEFNASVNASLFFAELGEKSSCICTEYDFYTQEKTTDFGWCNSKFVYSIEDYEHASVIDGKSPFIWRSGIKHDCSQIMEIERVEDYYKNGLKDEIQLEDNLVYGFLKSSDLKGEKTNTYRKLTIVTQKMVGQDTRYIKHDYPLTFEYLEQNKDYFSKRKSSIYKDKPPYSIFGVGAYSFAPFKVAISGLYKSTHFTLVLPNEDKPLMLDDTCYFISFDNRIEAEIAHYLLNAALVQNLLRAITFSDSKRAVNKEVLMRIDLRRVHQLTKFEDAQQAIRRLTLDEWLEFAAKLEGRREVKQMALF